ncbi:MAG: phage integrase SAM-like domain-containing protein [Bacteroidales bacterium]|nr:phage integrase SAM-like domain-containing protein [Bacteroidales bacterium]
MKFHYYLDKKENKKKEHQVRITVAMRGVRMVGTIGYNVPMSMWDAKRKQFKKGVANSDGVDSDIIKSRLSDIESHFNNLELRTTDKFTMEQLRAELAKAIAKNQAKLAAINDGASEEVIEKKEAEAEKKERKPKVKPATEYVDEFIREESRLKEWSLETLKMVKSFKNHLLKFKKTAGLDFFNKDGLDKYITYLRADCGLEENSVQKQYKNLTWFLRWAIRKGYTQIRDVESYDPVFKTVKKPVIFLTKEELDKLYKLEIPASGTVLKLKTYEGREYEKTVMDSAAMSKARDLFCFCAFTSLRYSDVVEVRKTDIQNGVMTVTTQKTHDRRPIVLHKNALAILDKYKDEDFKNGKALPYITNQQMNRALKDLGEICGFNTPYTITCYRNGTRYDEVYPKYELIGTHTGRKTFICFALSNGVPPDVVMKFTGHCDYKSMKPYIDITESAKRDAISLMEKAFDAK